MTFSSKFQFGDKVLIDGEYSITATVIGFAFYPHGLTVLCSWFSGGAVVESWIGEFRLSKKEPS